MGRGDAKDALRLRLATVGHVWDMALHRILPAAPEPARAQPAFQKTSFGNKNIDNRARSITGITNRSILGTNELLLVTYK